MPIKMTDRAHAAALKNLRQKAAAFEKKQRSQYAKVFTRWYKSVLPYRIGEVLEPLTKELKKGSTRFVVYDILPKHMGSGTLIMLGGWWLNAEHVPAKFDSFVVHGAGNPAKFKKASDQRNRPVPKTLQGKEIMISSKK